MKEHGKIAGLITACVLLIVAAITVLLIQLDFFGKSGKVSQRVNHSEVRAAYDLSAQESTEVVAKE
jgi:hypothetical protein